MKRCLFFTVAALVLLFVQSAFAQTEELPDTVWTKFTYPNAVNAVKFTHDGKYLASGGDDGIPKLWDAETGELVREFQGNYSAINSLDINSTNYQLAVINDSSIVRIWDISTGELVKVIDKPDNFRAPSTYTGVVFSNNGKYIATGITVFYNDNSTNSIILYSTDTWQKLSSIDDVRIAARLQFSKNDKILVNPTLIDLENFKYSVLRYSVPDLNYLGMIGYEGSSTVKGVAFSPNNEYLAGALESSPNKIWNTSDWKLFREFGEMWSNTKAIKISKDNNYVVSGPLVDLKQGALIIIDDILAKTTTYSYKLNYYMEYFGHDKGDWAYCLDISNNNNKIAVGTGAGIYMLNAKWNPTSVQENPVQIIEPIVFPNPTNSTANIRFNMLNSATINIQIYDINSRLIAHIFDGFLDTGNHNFVWNTAQSPSGSYFARITANGIVSSIQIIVNK
ncbi:hypothetical protein MASR1M45_00020 [Candidatus Kapaibacterium sp.]